MLIGKKKGKLESNWEVPFVVEKAYSNETYLLITMEEDGTVTPANARRWYSLNGELDAVDALGNISKLVHG